MPRRGGGPPAGLLLAWLLLAWLLLAGCTAPLTVDSPDPRGAAVDACAALVDAAPETVAEAQDRAVDTPGVALAWGDPAIVLRCGVREPEALQPGSRCDTVEDIDWFTQQAEDGYRFSTIGRATTVELLVPYDYEPAGDALVDVATAVRASVPVVNRCR